MIITSLYTYIAILIRKKIPIEKWFFPAFLIGLLIPDLDTIIIYLNFLNINNHTFGHSIISVLIIYLLLLIIYEIYKDKKILNLANGIISGMLLHISLDILISINHLNIFWPLPFSAISLYNNIIFQYYLKPYIIIIIFLLFRYFFFFSIECIIGSSTKKGYLIKLLSYSMKIEIYLIISYSLFTLLNIKHISNLIFSIGYCFSISITYYTIIAGWNSFNYFPSNKNKKNIFKKERELININ